MFQVGEYVVYGTKGPCLISDITKLKLHGCDAHRDYYVMRPVNAKESIVYSPVDNVKVMMRRVLDRKEAEQLVQDISDIDEMQISSEKYREEQYREVLKKSDLKEYVGMLKALVRKKQDRLALGRKFTAVDERYLKITESVLVDELSISLGKTKEEVAGYFSFSGRMMNQEV